MGTLEKIVVLRGPGTFEKTFNVVLFVDGCSVWFDEDVSPSEVFATHSVTCWDRLIVD